MHESQVVDGVTFQFTTENTALLLSDNNVKDRISFRQCDYFKIDFICACHIICISRKKGLAVLQDIFHCNILRYGSYPAKISDKFTCGNGWQT